MTIRLLPSGTTCGDPMEHPPFAKRERKLTMPFILYVDDNCPKCRKPTMQALVELHPTNPDLALQNFECADCGPVKTKIISLTPKTDLRSGDSPTEGAAA